MVKPGTDIDITTLLQRSNSPHSIKCLHQTSATSKPTLLASFRTKYLTMMVSNTLENRPSSPGKKIKINSKPSVTHKNTFYPVTLGLGTLQ